MMTPMGRPAIDNPNTINLTVRINSELNEKLIDKYKKNNLTKGEVVRMGIIKVIDNK